MVSIQVLNIVDILSMTKVIENRKLCMISFIITLDFLCQLNVPKFCEKLHTCDMIDHYIDVCAVVLICVM